MKYQKVKKATFLDRPNRFIANVLLDGEAVTAHVKNTGRCKELLIPGATVYLEEPELGTRKTKYDLIAVEKQRADTEPLLINMDSQAPNEAASEWLLSAGLFSVGATLRREVTVGGSRFDFAVTEPHGTTYVEVKGVTLERDGLVLFPDAPTERGVKHIRELTELSLAGCGAILLFVVQMKGARAFTPNAQTHKEFAEALREAHDGGVTLLAVDCIVTPDSMCIDKPVKLVI